MRVTYGIQVQASLGFPIPLRLNIFFLRVLLGVDQVYRVGTGFAVIIKASVFLGLDNCCFIIKTSAMK